MELPLPGKDINEGDWSFMKKSRDQHSSACHHSNKDSISDMGLLRSKISPFINIYVQFPRIKMKVSLRNRLLQTEKLAANFSQLKIHQTDLYSKI